MSLDSYWFSPNKVDLQVHPGDWDGSTSTSSSLESRGQHQKCPLNSYLSSLVTPYLYMFCSKNHIYVHIYSLNTVDGQHPCKLVDVVDRYTWYTTTNGPVFTRSLNCFVGLCPVLLGYSLNSYLNWFQLLISTHFRKCLSIVGHHFPQKIAPMVFFKWKHYTPQNWHSPQKWWFPIGISFFEGVYGIFGVI